MRRGMARKRLFGRGADHRDRLTIAFRPGGEIAAERGEFRGPVIGRQAEQEAPAEQVVETHRLLGNDQRIAQRQDDSRRPDRDPPCLRREEAGIDQRIEHLPHIAEARIVERHVAQPDRGEIERVHLLRQRRMVRQRRQGASG